MTADVEVRRATLDDLEILAPLFDAYRQFYRRESDVAGARQFLFDRLGREESVIFVAFDGSAAVGFTQLYPLFSSAAMARIFILNDLFVAPEARGKGVGTALLSAAADYGREQGAVRLGLSTEVTNTTAQSVYERAGWKRDTAFFVYHLAL
jgi:GNAT superfamily N-acetyltransferase